MRHEPGYDNPHQDQGDYPGRRAQPPSRPQAPAWQPGQMAQARYDADPRNAGDEQTYPREQHYSREQPYSRDQHSGEEPGSEDSYGASQFVPGFAYDDSDDAESDDIVVRPQRGSRRKAKTPRRSGPGDGNVPPPPAGRPRRRRARWVAPLVALLVILIPLGIGGNYVYGLYMNKYHPSDFAGAGTGNVVVQVGSGETPTSLGPKLVKDGVVASSRAFILAAEHSSNPDGLLPGFYGVHKQMKASLAYAALLNPKNLVQVKVTIPEGWRLNQIVAYLGAKSGIPLSQYQKVLKNPAQLDLPASAYGNPEGYLFPATYEVLPHETALGVLKQMVARFDQQAEAVNLSASASHLNLSASQAITVASLLEAEGGKTSDYPKIARVIYNRLAAKMPLQLDSTVLYGLDKYGIIASDQQLTSNSPYNTYKHTGLPPGPIDSPGAAAIQAALHPASASWLYFVTVNPKTRETLFTSSEAQFQQYRQELEKNLGQG
jgi:UPF0755 protein